MKKVLLTISASLIWICISCNNNSIVSAKDNSQAQKNLDAWHVVSMAFATGNQDMIDSVIADDYVDHKSKGDVRGRDSVKANIGRTHANLKNLKMEVIKELAENEYAFFWMHFTGNGTAASGMFAGPFDMNTVQVVKFMNGKTVEHWDYIEGKQLMKMMQHIRTNTDSSAMKK